LCSFDFKDLGGKLANRTLRFANRCLRFALDQFFHSFLSEALSVGRFCVTLHFRKRSVSRDRRNLVRSTSHLSQPPLEFWTEPYFAHSKPQAIIFLLLNFADVVSPFFSRSRGGPRLDTPGSVASAEISYCYH
jgi:hypothetical protein